MRQYTEKSCEEYKVILRNQMFYDIIYKYVNDKGDWSKLYLKKLSRNDKFTWKEVEPYSNSEFNYKLREHINLRRQELEPEGWVNPPSSTGTYKLKKMVTSQMLTDKGIRSKKKTFIITSQKNYFIDEETGEWFKVAPVTPCNDIDKFFESYRLFDNYNKCKILDESYKYGVQNDFFVWSRIKDGSLTIHINKEGDTEYIVNSQFAYNSIQDLVNLNR
jgi:hypothetical protein